MAEHGTPDDPHARLREQFGAIDIYLFDQLLRGNLRRDMRVLDAGCGSGRNLVYLLREGFDVTALDASAQPMECVRQMSERLGRPLGPERLVVGSIADLPFPDEAFDAVLSNAVLHFAPDEATFLAMVSELGRVLAPGGLLFARLASSIGIEDRIAALGDGRYRLPDGSDRFLVDEPRLINLTQSLGGSLLDPIKTTNVQGLRCMTTWVVRKHGAP